MSISDSSPSKAAESEDNHRLFECNSQSNPQSGSLSGKKNKKLLIITSSGGGGLIQAANAKEQEAKVKDPNISIVRRDLMMDWLGKRFGQYCVNRWNGAQIRGDVADQAFCAWAQLTIAEYLFWPIVFIQSLITLFKEDVDEIIDTQCNGTSAILNALRIFNQAKKKKVTLQKILVDLPTKKATHFFHPIKKLSKKNRRLLRLTAISPLLEEGQTPEEFWQTHCRLSDKEIQYEDVYVRQSFRKFQNRPRSGESMVVKVRYKNSDELQLMKNVFERGSIRAEIKENEVNFKISAEDRMIAILLGSNPANEATFNYVKNLITVAKETKTTGHLFVFCANHQPGEQSLFRKVADWVVNMNDYPKHFSIVPFSFQDDDVIAPLFFRSDLSCTRSGGQTAMELMCVSSGEICIHSEAKKSPEKDLTMDQLLKGIPGWESENAVYLQKVRGAKIITPETIGLHARRLLQANKEQAFPNRVFQSKLL